MSTGSRPFSGRAALIWLLLFFGVVASANGIMISLALTIDPERRAAHPSNPAEMDGLTNHAGTMAQGAGK
jgi:hypothetical protein